MRTLDLISFTGTVLNRHRFRTVMLLLSISIGVASVVLLTTLGESARMFVLGEFSSMGSDLMIMMPGKKETTGGMPPMFGESTRDITLQDFEAIERLPSVESAAPLIPGNATISHNELSRDVIVLGTTTSFFQIRDLKVVQGNPLPVMPLDQGQPVAVIGKKLKDELFGSYSALGEWIRISDWRFRIVGVLEPKGESLAMDLSDTLLIPIASAQSLFNIEGIFRVMIRPRPGSDLIQTKQQILSTVKERHGGFEDVTIINQDAMLGAFNDIFKMMTLAVTSIAAISMLVAGILIMNVTLITINQRTSEIGLLKAVGAQDKQIRTIFLTEAGLLSLLGALLGVIIALLLVFAIQHFVPQLPTTIPVWSVAISVILAVITGLIFAYLPAKKAAQLQPVEALMKK